jgi:hypothetical protein
MGQELVIGYHEKNTVCRFLLAEKTKCLRLSRVAKFTVSSPVQKQKVENKEFLRQTSQNIMLVNQNA